MGQSGQRFPSAPSAGGGAGAKQLAPAPRRGSRTRASSAIIPRCIIPRRPIARPRESRRGNARPVASGRAERRAASTRPTRAASPRALRRTRGNPQVRNGRQNTSKPRGPHTERRNDAEARRRRRDARTPGRRAASTRADARRCGRAFRRALGLVLPSSPWGDEQRGWAAGGFHGSSPRRAAGGPPDAAREGRTERSRRWTRISRTSLFVPSRRRSRAVRRVVRSFAGGAERKCEAAARRGAVCMARQDTHTGFALPGMLPSEIPVVQYYTTLQLDRRTEYIV